MVGEGAEASAGDNRSPHSLQNFAAVEFGVPHRGQVRVKAVPHSTQNFPSLGLLALQFAHRMASIAGPDRHNAVPTRLMG